jgi:hypothetical protein
VVVRLDGDWARSPSEPARNIPMTNIDVNLMKGYLNTERKKSSSLCRRPARSAAERDVTLNSALFKKKKDGARLLQSLCLKNLALPSTSCFEPFC